jgi:hypothetical protein
MGELIDSTSFLVVGSGTDIKSRTYTTEVGFVLKHSFSSTDVNCISDTITINASTSAGWSQSLDPDDGDFAYTSSWGKGISEITDVGTFTLDYSSIDQPCKHEIVSPTYLDVTEQEGTE